MGKKGKQNRKKRKQARKLRQNETSKFKEIDKLARELSKRLPNPPPRPHQNNKVIVDGKLACIPFGELTKYRFCKDCDAKNYCSKEVKWIVTKGVFERR